MFTKDFLMSEKDTKKLLSRIEALEKHNTKLKKELSKHKKYVSKAADMIMDNYDKCQNEEYYEKTEKVKYCDECGKGELKLIKVLGFSFEICTLCQIRKKIK